MAGCCTRWYENDEDDELKEGLGNQLEHNLGHQRLVKSVTQVIVTMEPTGKIPLGRPSVSGRTIFNGS